MNKSQYTICVYDHRGGSYLNVAQLLAPYFAKTYYHSECRDAFPHPALAAIGRGFAAFERVDDFWSNLDKYDIVVFPDGGCQDIADHLRQMGKMVFGGSHMYDIEESRSLFNDLLQRVQLPTPTSIVVKGLKQLEETLKPLTNKWIKVSKWRNLVETYNWIDWTSSHFWLDDLTTKLGPLSEQPEMEFLIQDPIDAIAEVGFDGYTLNGQLPSSQIVGIECKDAGYVGRVYEQSEVPEPVKTVNTRFQPVLASYASNGFYSTEIRYTADKQPYYVDIAARAGMPPSSSYLSNISNWDEIIPSIASGKWVEPQYKSKYMVELILKSNYSREGYLPVTFPEEYSDNITFKGATVEPESKRVFIIPFSFSNIDMVEFGSVIVNDDDLENAVTRALEIAASVKAYELRYEQSAPDIINEELENLKKQLSIEF